MRIITFQTIRQLTFLPRLFPVNVYLVEETDSLTLIDTGLPYSAKGILKAAARIGKPIARIVLTHAHGDHLGSLDALKQQLPAAAVFLSARDERLLNRRDLTLDADEPQTPIRGDLPKHVQTRPDVLLQDGDRIGSLLAIAAPGHTPGSMAFLDTRNRSLIAGDAFQIRGGLAVSGQMQLSFPFPAMATWNVDRALDSARKLVGLQPALLAVGHGSMLENPVQAMKRAIDQCAAKRGALGHVAKNRP